MVSSLADNTRLNISSVEQWISTHLKPVVETVTCAVIGAASDENQLIYDDKLIASAFAFRKDEIEQAVAGSNSSPQVDITTLPLVLEIATILFELQVDQDTLVAGILYDRTQHSPARTEKIAKIFNSGVLG